MKKIAAVLASVVIVAFSTVSAFAASVQSPTAPTIPTTAPVQGEVIVSVDKDLEWKEIYVYYYNENPQIGSERESVILPVLVDESGNKYVKLDIPEGTKYAIFHNGKGEMTSSEPVTILDESYVISYSKSDKPGTPTSPQTADYMAFAGLGVLLAFGAGAVAVNKLASSK